MKNYRTLSRKQLALSGGVLALLTVVAIVPWRVVAQEPPVAEAEPALPAEPKNEESEQRHKLLVGRWRDANQKEVVFFNDGTYEDFGANIFGREYTRTRDGVSRTSISFERGQGRWVLDDQTVLRLFQDDKSSLWNRRVQNEGKLARVPQYDYVVMRLDESFLRISNTGAVGNLKTFFFRRIEEKPVDAQLSDVPAEMRKLAELALLSPEETSAFSTWLANQQIEDAELQMVGRVIDARRRKITLAELFGMDEKQVAAFHELLRQTRGGGYESLLYLANGDQLSTTELQAFGKIRSAVDSFDALSRVILEEQRTFIQRRQVPGSYRAKSLEQRFAGRGGFRGGFGGEEEFGGRAPKGRPADAAAPVPDVKLDKIVAAFADLEHWFNETVFAVPSE